MSQFRYHYANCLGLVFSIPAEIETKYFSAIEEITGLDRAITEPIIKQDGLNLAGFRFFYLDSDVVPLADPTKAPL